MMEQIAYLTFPCYIIQRTDGWTDRESYGRRVRIETGRLTREVDGREDRRAEVAWVGQRGKKMHVQLRI